METLRLFVFNAFQNKMMVKSVTVISEIVSAERNSSPNCLSMHFQNSMPRKKLISEKQNNTNNSTNNKVHPHLKVA